MKTYDRNVIERENILMTINLLDRDSLRIYLEAGDLEYFSVDEIGQFSGRAKQLHESLVAVGQAIRYMIHRSESDACVFFQVKEEVLNSLFRIKSNLDGVEGILNPQSRLYN